MKNISKLVLTLLLVSFVIPNLALAAWWNPFSWFKKGPSIKNEVVKIVTQTSTTTISTSTKTEDIKTPDNSAIIKAEVEKQVQAALKEKATQDAINLEKQKNLEWIAQQNARQAEQEAANLAALQAAQLQSSQNAANLATQQQAAQNAANQAITQAQNEKKAKLDAINKQIADLNMKYANDIANVDKDLAGRGVTTAYRDALINKISSDYQTSYNLLKAQYQQIQYSN